MGNGEEISWEILAGLSQGGLWNPQEGIAGGDVQGALYRCQWPVPLGDDDDDRETGKPPVWLAAECGRSIKFDFVHALTLVDPIPSHQFAVVLSES